MDAPGSSHLSPSGSNQGNFIPEQDWYLGQMVASVFVAAHILVGGLKGWLLGRVNTILVLLYSEARRLVFHCERPS